MASPFSGRNVASIVAYSIGSGLALSWLILLVMVPMVSTPLSTDLAYEVNLVFQILIIVLVLGAVFHNGLDLIDKAGRGMVRRVEGPKLSRFTLGQRIQHIWLIATTTTLALTGFAQMNYESWGRQIIVPMGGLQVNMDIHLLAGFLLGVLVAYHFGFYGAQYLVKRAKGEPASLSIAFGKKDITDFFQNLRYMFGRGTEPKYDRYNYAQKFDYWGIYWGMVILGLPGVILWAYQYAFYGNILFIFHTDEALLAVLWLPIFHFYQTHFNPKVFPMNPTFITGTISEREMKEEHSLELQKLRAGGRQA